MLISLEKTECFIEEQAAKSALSEQEKKNKNTMTMHGRRGTQKKTDEEAESGGGTDEIRKRNKTQNVNFA